MSQHDRPYTEITIRVSHEVRAGTDRWSGKVDASGADPYEIIFGALVLLEGLAPADGENPDEDPLPEIVEALRAVLDLGPPREKGPINDLKGGLH